MADDIRRRLACDRCHSQKLRCPRQPGVDTCDRCIKAKASCIYSPFRQKRSSERNEEDSRSYSEQRHAYARETTQLSLGESINGEQTTSKRRRPAEEPYYTSSLNLECAIASESNQLLTNEMNDEFSFASSSHGFETGSPFDDLNFGMQNHFPTFDFTPLSPLLPRELSPKPTSIPSLNRASLLPMESVPDVIKTSLLEAIREDPALTVYENIPVALGWNFREETLELDTASRCIGRLSVLSTELYEHSTTVPSLPSNESDTPEEDFEKATNPLLKYHFEETFRLTQEMIDIYPTILNICSSQNQSPASYGSSSSGLRSEIPGSLSADHSTILLALSCHIRLIEIYETLFGHARLCIKFRGFVPQRRQGALITPVLRIGNYEPSQSSAASMQMLFLVQLISQLSSYASELVSKIQFPQDKGRNNGGRADATNQSPFALSIAAAENVSQRSKEMTRAVGGLRSQLLSSGLLA